jgi:hypothetical protein
MTKTGKKRNVNVPSNGVTISFDHDTRMKYIHTYANTEHVAVMAKTPVSLISLTSPPPIAITHTAQITIRLNAAEPTIVDGPNSP